MGDGGRNVSLSSNDTVASEAGIACESRNVFGAALLTEGFAHYIGRKAVIPKKTVSPDQ
jgi:hypothetical protein